MSQRSQGGPAGSALVPVRCRQTNPKEERSDAEQSWYIPEYASPRVGGVAQGADYNKALDVNPQWAEVYTRRGGIYAASGQYAPAVTDFTRALEVNPLLVEAYTKRCMAYSHMDQQTQALADCARALALDPRSEDAFHARALAYARTGQYAQALTDTIQVLKLNPWFFQGYYTQALLYEQIGRRQEAVEAYKRFLQTVPSPASPQYAGEIQQARQRVRDLGH